MKNHMDGAKPSSSAPAEHSSGGALARNKKLAEALKANLLRRKRATGGAPPVPEEKNG